MADPKKNESKSATKARAKAAAPDAAPNPHAPIAPTEAAFTSTLAALRTQLAALQPPEAPVRKDWVSALIHAIVAHDQPCGYGQEALRRISESFVDRNELRVSEAFEVAELLEDFPIPDLYERCTSLRDSIAQIYNDQNGVTLEFLPEAGIADRTNFFNRVPAVPQRVQRWLNHQLAIEEAVFSDRATQRVVQRLGMDPKGGGVAEFFTELRTLLTPFGHVPLQVGPDLGGGKVRLEPVLCPSCLLGRLAPAGKR